MTKKNLRKNPRADLRIAVQVEQQSRLQQFYSRNLSSGGIFLEFEGDAPSIGSKFNLSFDVPGLTKKITVEAEVIHQHAYESMDAEMRKHKKTGVGFRFLKISPKDQKLISEYITGKGLHVES